MKAEKDGFTMVELMITLVCNAIAILTVSIIVFIAYREWSADNSYVQLRRDVALAVQMMAQDVRESSTNSIDTSGSHQITFLVSPVRSNEIRFTQSGDRLNRYVNNVLYGQIITKGLRSFDPVNTGSGIRLHLVATNQYKIAITNETFVTVRN